MNKHLLIALCAITTPLIASAQVPVSINYQGRLTTPDGAPVTGTKSFALSVFDAETSGNLLYTETIGPVTLDANGVYSFQFGEAGTSNTQVTETVATTNGTASTFQKVLSNSPVVAGSVSVTDGTYTWSQAAGSSNEDDFGVSYSTSLRRVTVNYYNSAPAAGTTINATYRYGTNGITGALGSGTEHWMAVSVDGVTQGTRQRVLTVPFSSMAMESQLAHRLKTRNVTIPANIFISKILGRHGTGGFYGPYLGEPIALPLIAGDNGSGGGFKIWSPIDKNILTINSIEIEFASKLSTTHLRILRTDGKNSPVIVAESSSSTSGKISVTGEYNLDWKNFQYLIEIAANFASNNNTAQTSAEISSCVVKGKAIVHD